MDTLKKLLRRILLNASVLVLCASAALGAPTQQPAGADRWAALADTVFDHVARDHELPNSSVPNSLSQDAEGFIWVGTQNGLARWDGYRFRTYNSDPASPGTLPDNYVRKLYTDSLGRLWVGTIGGGLARYDRDHDRFVRYAVGPNGLSHVSIHDIADDGVGGVWVATEGGLDHVLPETGTVSHLRHDDRDPGSLPNSRIVAVLRSRDGTLWVGTVVGLVRRGPGDRAFVSVSLPTPAGKPAQIQKIFEDTQQRLWIGTGGDGAYIIDPREAAARQVLDSNPEHSVLQTADVHDIAEVRPGEVWLGTAGHGIVAVDTVSFRTRRIRHDPTLQESLADDEVLALYKDRSGLVWVGTDRALSRYDPGQAGFYTIFGASSRHHGLLEENVFAMLEMPDGHVWVGLESNGIDVVDPAGVLTAGLRSDPNRPETSLPQARIFAFARAESGDVYVGTGRGLYRVDPLARNATRLTLAGLDPTTSLIAVLLHRGVLWVGGRNGLWEVDLGSTGGTHTPLPAKRLGGLRDEWVTAIEPDPAGSLWIGTRHGLIHFDPTSRALERILPDVRDPGALVGNYVSTLLIDLRGRLWVGTLGGGINVLEGRDHEGRPRFHHLGVVQGLANQNINKLLADSRGKIWASTDDGLALIDPASFAIRTLRRAEGVAISNYIAWEGAVTHAGELLFPGFGGVTVVNPERLQSWRYHPPVVVTDVRLGGKWVPSSYLNLHSGTREPLTITPGANSIAVEFSALDYSAPERNHYAYKLEGFDVDWTETDPSRRLAAYTNLPPGDYHLRLRGTNRDGVWTDAVLTVPIRVLPAWFQTLVFKVLVAFAFAGVLALAYRLRFRYIAERMQERHRARLAERDRIARELHDTLLQSTEGLILKVHSVVDQLSVDDPRRALLSASLDRASELAYEGRERIQGLRDGARSRPEIAASLEKAAREMIQGTQIRIELQIEGSVRDLRPYVWEELYRISYEALWNAYRHARARQITVFAGYGDRELLIRIGDDGGGIAARALQSAQAGGHFGLAGMHERARGLDARLHIDSSESGGTRVEIRINSVLAYVRSAPRRSGRDEPSDALAR